HKCISPNVADRFANATELYRSLPNSFIAKSYSPEPLNGIWQLHILNGVERGKVFNLNALLSLKSDNCLTLGFGEDKSDLTNDIGIQEYYSRFISRKHATFIFEEGSWYLKDGQMSETSLTEWKQSKNGTFVNSYQLEENEKFLLKDGDLIQIGGETSLQIKLY
ncbi:MAG: FHA domain-containing protein, partial [Saprospiraceae bacterium]